MKKLPAALKEALEGAEQEDRDELAAILNCYGDPDKTAVPAIWCLTRGDAVRRLVDALGVRGVEFRRDAGVTAMLFHARDAVDAFVDAVRMSGAVMKALTTGGLDAVAAIPADDDATSGEPPPPACPELVPDNILARLRAVYASCSGNMSPDDARDVNAALAWCEAGRSVLPPIWALERIGMATTDDRDRPYTAVGHARGCLVRHLRRNETVPGVHLMLSSCPHDLYTLPPREGDASNPLVGYLYTNAAAARDLLPEATALLALDSCPLDLPEGEELDGAMAIVGDPRTMWTKLLGRVARALDLDVTGFLHHDPAFGSHQPATLRIGSPSFPASSPCGPESRGLASKAAALLVGTVLRPRRDIGRRAAAVVRTDPGGWTPAVPTPAVAATADADEAPRIWFSETHARDTPVDPPGDPDDDADAVLESGEPRWTDGRAAAFYGAVVSLLFAHGIVTPRRTEGTAKRLRPDAVVTAAHASVFASEDPGAAADLPRDAVGVELVVETNVDARVHRNSTPSRDDFNRDMETSFLLAFLGGVASTEEILRRSRVECIPCDPSAWAAVARTVGFSVMYDEFRASENSSGLATTLREMLRVERRTDGDGRMLLVFRTKNGYLGDLLVAMAFARRGRPFVTKGLARAASRHCTTFAPAGRDHADAVAYIAAAARVMPAHVAAVSPLSLAPSSGFMRSAYVESGATLRIGADAEHDKLAVDE